jgi:WD40 repeat protein
MDSSTDLPTRFREARKDDSTSLAPGLVLGHRYEIKRRLGGGGMGEVFQAFDLKLRVDVALKSLRMDLFASAPMLELLRSEVRAAREVTSPNVCRIFDLVVDEGRELVSMEFIDGVTLLDLLKAKGPLPLTEASQMASQFLSGLEAIHRAGLVHRDIKPENVMITRAGRVVIMDFGIARPAAEEKEGTISGTPAYMAPEQLRGDPVDARTDVFAAGIVLAEMVSGEGVSEQSSRERLWDDVRADPPRLPDTPWRAALERAVSKEPEERFPTAQALAHALSEVALRVEGAEDRTPYPGLDAFTEADARFFFGREAEVETAWKKFGRLHLMALIGPSGAGKSSFLRAGLLPAKPEGWSVAIATPGGRPFESLSQALASEPSPSEDDDMVASFTRWRTEHKEALLIVDQFEELFTLSPPDVQTRFSRLLSRLALEADVRVLVCLRDDFLLHCHHQESLSPIFSELLPLSPPGGDALRRALVQPALLSGYRFEDEALVEEMLSVVAEERGALPLLAFTVARLWEKRDRESGLLTRRAYRELGGVEGALAQHAEATLSRIGAERTPIVREVFRSLVTAQGTRAVLELEELVSVFGAERESAREVVRALVDARLLTEFEVLDVERTGEGPRPRIEIIHESMLSAWPRLLRWRTQDSAFAQLRDQMRQAAALWQERGRPDELLWTGASFREFELWREQYSGGLTATEESFARAMVEHAGRRKRRRRLLSLASAAVLLVVAGALGMLWRQSEASRREAVAAQLLALGRLQLEDYPTAALAYALASLETLDSSEARRFAVEALSRGPTTFLLPGEAGSVKFSPDGRWLATYGAVSGLRLFSREGGAPKVLAGGQGGVLESGSLHFDADGKLLLLTTGTILRVWTVPEGKEVRNLELEGPTASVVRGNQLVTFTTTADGTEIVRSQPLEGGEPRLVARWEAGDVTRTKDISGASFWSVDASGELLMYARGDGVYVSPLEDLETGPERLVGKHDANVVAMAFHPAGDRVVSADQDGDIHFWPLSKSAAAPERTVRGRANGPGMQIVLDPAGRRLVTVSPGFENVDLGYVWDLAGPPDTDPVVLYNSDNGVDAPDLHPEGRWVATGSGLLSGGIWPLHHAYPYVLRGQSPPFIQIRFTPDGKHLVSASDDGTVRLWPLSAAAGERSQILIEVEDDLGVDLSVDPQGRNALAMSRFAARAFLVPLSGGEPRVIGTPGGAKDAHGPAFSPDGRFLALCGHAPAFIQILDLQSGETRILDPRVGDGNCGMGEEMAGGVTDVEFTRDGRLLSSGMTGLRRWDVEEGTSELLLPCRDKQFRFFSVSADRSRVLAWDFDLAEELPSALTFLDLEAGTSWTITSHGNRIFAAALDPSGEIVATGDFDGVVRVGGVSGEEPHLLFGHEPGLEISSVAISPDRRFIASASQDGTIRVWPMPEGEPSHTLPYEELLDRLKALTNVRVVSDGEAETGYSLETGPFPGWKTAPTW